MSLRDMIIAELLAMAMDDNSEPVKALVGLESNLEQEQERGGGTKPLSPFLLSAVKYTYTTRIHTTKVKRIYK